MIRYSIATILLLLGAFVLQQFLPAFTGLHGSRVLLIHLVFLCCAVTVGIPTMLSLAFICGFLWDAQHALGPHGGDPEIYTQQVENLRFGSSILLFGLVGLLMHGVQPLFKQGKWQVSALLSGIAVLVFLAAEYTIINFVRGDFTLGRATLRQMAFTSMFTMLLSPLVFWLLFRLAGTCGHIIHPAARRRPR